jgi:hypothetical protein
VRLHHLVEGAPHVQHHRVQLAARRADVGHPAGLVLQRPQAQRLGQPAGRVDGQHHGAPAAFGGAQGQRGRGRGLADPAGAAAHHDPGVRVVEQRVDVERRCHEAAPLSAGTATPCSTSAAARS